MNQSKKSINRWKSFEKVLLYYETNYSPASWRIFGKSTGFYLFIRCIVLLVCLIFANNQFNFWNIIFGLLSLAFLFDVLISNTSIAFISRNPINELRSFLLTFFAYTHIIIIYGVFYKFVQHQLSETMCSWQYLYFSTVTITTLGFGDFVPQRWGTMAQVIVIFELLTGLFFVIGVFTRIVASKKTN